MKEDGTAEENIEKDLSFVIEKMMKRDNSFKWISKKMKEERKGKQRWLEDIEEDLKVL